MKAYRVKHKPSGLYYQPSGNGNNLSKRGKIYNTPNNILNYNKSDDFIYITMSRSSRLFPVKKINFKKNEGWRDSTPTAKVSKSDFEIEYL